jgi:hypothetical protein
VVAFAKDDTDNFEEFVVFFGVADNHIFVVAVVVLQVIFAFVLVALCTFVYYFVHMED